MTATSSISANTSQSTLRERWHWYLYKWATGYRVADDLARLEREQYLPREQLEALQLERLRAIVAHAATHVPYYRNLFRTIGFSPSDMRSLDDLAALPVLERETVRDQVDQLIADNVARDRLHLSRTAGTTGMPLRVYSDAPAMKVASARYWRAHLAWGYRPGDKILRLLRIPGRDSWSTPIRDWVRAVLSRDKRMNVDDCSEQGLARVATAIRAWQPQFLRGNVAVFNLLAAYLEHANERLEVPCVISGAELMTADDRARFLDRIGRDVLDFYSAHEAPGLAFECMAHEGLHLASESFVVEVIANGRPARAGEVGEVLVTVLTNPAMPLIRYRLGDALTPLDKPCSCGRTLPLARMTHGRMLDIISTPDGHFLPPYVFLQLFRRVGETTISRFQIVQDEIARLRIRVVRKPDYSTETERTLVQAIRHEMGEGVCIEFEYVEKIDLTPGGKRRITQSCIPVHFNAESRR